MKALTLVFCLAATVGFAAGDTVEIFVDKQDFFIRAGTNRGLKVGSEVLVLGDRIADTNEYRVAGRANVLEVFETIARVNLDAAAQKVKNPKLAMLQAGARVERPAPQPLTPPPPPPKDPPNPKAWSSEKDELPPADGVLQGIARKTGGWIGTRIIVKNTSTIRWTRCDVRLPDNRHYRIDSLDPREEEGIMLTKFTQDGVRRDVAIDSVLMQCNEGVGKLPFAL
jgi:hypothetical protein